MVLLPPLHAVGFALWCGKALFRCCTLVGQCFGAGPELAGSVVCLLEGVTLCKGGAELGATTLHSKCSSCWPFVTGCMDLTSQLCIACL